LSEIDQPGLAARWPDVAAVPRSPVRARIARRLFRTAVAGLPIRVVVPGRPGVRQIWGTGDLTSPTMILHRPDDFFARVGSGGLIGFGESYLAADWSAPVPAGHEDSLADERLVDLLTVFCSRLAQLVPPGLQRLRRLAVRYQPAGERNTPGGARSNISRHYDLSNDLFATFLDETMTYSSALFDQAQNHDEAAVFDDLAGAQGRKIERLLDQCGVRAGSRVLEIGTGWGELAIRAASRGASVHSITLSEEQLELARARIAARGLSDQATVELCDYREVAGSYDAVVSVEMIEAVGKAYWDTYFATIDRALAPGGTAGIQAITMPHDRMLASRRTYTWMHKYVFPGGLLPSVRAVHEAAASAGLAVTDDFAFGDSYAQTLRLWRERFEERADDVTLLGFDSVFRRMWTFYLAYCEAGFRCQYLDVHQFTLRRP
jgi:cyclopropane-fatty-acyl-phospholipid synthase